MDHGRGTEVWDVDGNRLLDFAAGIAVVTTGHSHPKIVKAIQDQAEKFIHISSDFYHENWIRLGEKLAEHAPWKEDTCSFMTNSGTESVEGAIKLARYHTQASHFIGFLGAFHGRTIGAVTFTASKANYKNGFFPLMNGVLHAPYPNPYRPLLARKPGMGDGETVVSYIEEELIGRLVPGKDVAGILIEPIQGEGGYLFRLMTSSQPCENSVKIWHPSHRRRSSMRMGRRANSGRLNTSGLSLTSLPARRHRPGMPLGLWSQKKVMNWPKGSHGNTYGGNPISCAASLATIQLIEDELMENTRVVGAYCKDGLFDLQKKHPSIGDVRGMGFMLGVEFVEDRESKAPAEKLRDDVVDFAFERGLLLLGCGKSVIRIAPPLSTSKSEVDDALKIIDESISLAEKKHSLG